MVEKQDTFIPIGDAGIKFIINLLKEKDKEVKNLIEILLKKAPEYQRWVDANYGYLFKD